jgi:hypothetical protein
MGLYKVKNLYVNGCSFTAGHTLQDNKIWPKLLSEKLDLNLINCAVNGQSFDSIYLNTINHLSDLDPSDTLVVIGTTWPTRYLVQFDKYNLNITAVDIPSSTYIGTRAMEFRFLKKIGKHRRLSSPYELNPSLDRWHTLEWSKNLSLVCESFSDYYENLVKFDNNIINNQWVNFMSKLVGLQSFLENNNFEYRIVDFSSVGDMRKQKNNWKKHNINNMLNESKMIYFDGEWKKKYVDGHPTKEGCVNISEVLYDSFDR